MIADFIRERLEKDPFEPLRIRASSGKSYFVSRPFLVAHMKSEVIIGEANSDRWAQVPYLHVAGIESVGNGSDHGKDRRRRGR
jgi:hypothetical protein